MGKAYTLLKNIGILTISSFSSKFLNFLLVPLYTSVLSTTEYGNFDIIYVTITLLAPILTLNITEGAMRFLLDDKNKRNDIYKITARIILSSVILIIAFTVLNYIFGFISAIREYWLQFIVYYIAFVLYQATQDIARGLNSLKHVGISGIINSIAIIVFNILFLIVFRYGLQGYFSANIFANFLAAGYLIVVTKIHKETTVRKINKKLQKDVVSYSFPTIFNTVGWWVNNVSDRYVVTALCGAAANGIYSIAYKIPNILSVFQSIFNQAWTISLVRQYQRRSSDKFVTKVYRSYNIIMLSLCSILMLFNRTIARLLYADEFYLAWRYVPLLILSILFAALAGLLGAIFNAEKNTKSLGRSTMIGAIVNVILNIILVSQFGAIGAAIATVVSSFLVWLIRYIESQRYIKFDNIYLYKDVLAYLLILGQTVTCTISEKNLITSIIGVIVLSAIAIINHNEITYMKSRILSYIKRHKKI